MKQHLLNRKQIMNCFLLLLACLLSFTDVFAQETYPVNGVHDTRDGKYAFTNATIHTHYNQKVENATLLIEKGKIVSVGTSVRIPKDAVTIDMAGKHIYPSFIDLYTEYGIAEAEKSDHKWSDPPIYISKKDGAYSWNSAIHPEIEAAELFKVDNKAADEYRKLGFGTVLTHHQDGIARGSGSLVLLHNDRENKVIVNDKASAHYSFRKGHSPMSYPSSLMGSIALLRQTYLDADWYAKAKPQDEEGVNLSLQAFNELQNLPQIFTVVDRLTALRADKVGDEFGKQYIIKGGGDEFMRLNELKASNASMIIPLKFPEAYDVEDPFDAQNVSLKDMKHWELAPHNARLLADAGIEFALTTSDLKKKDSFLKQLRKAIDSGLSEEDALKALTHTPAKLVNASGEVGSLEQGKIANFLITSGPIFDKKSKIHQNWIAGQKHVLAPIKDKDLIGVYDLKLGDTDYTLIAKGKVEQPDFLIKWSNKKKDRVKVNHKQEEGRISLNFNNAKDSTSHAKMGTGIVRLSGWLSDDLKTWTGKADLPNGEWVDWSAKRTKEDPEEAAKAADEEEEEKDKKKETAKKAADTPQEKKRNVLTPITYPFLPYGWEEQPTAETVLFTNATVWTNEEDGILEETDVLIQGGKIKSIGKGLSAPSGAKTVDATGKHLTCGVIDEHSHIAISRGVNESGQASSAEVRIGDVVNSDDINIYRQLSGGVTTSQLLHGSANPIGGQSAIIKLRWGMAPEKMKFEGADGFIKFALGENVKQSNWGDSNTTRFPQSRMGVEQAFIDHFSRAQAYGEALKGGGNVRKGRKAAPSGSTVRRDLELDALLEIIESKRFITCHSYVQSEITMLMRVAEQFGFRVNTFTHILEGYKIADKMKEHGVSGSTFSDWWAYKYEVIDAIPHNGAIMHEMGVTTSFNSDDAEMARRLNQEAAKAVKYGGISEEEAWKFVTLNPAKMLHIDNRVGSIKAGKDADVVLWSDNPLSIYAKAQQTYVDGVCYFDMEEDQKHRKAIKAERDRLIQKMLAVKKNGGKTQKPMPKQKKLYHCDDLGEEEHEDFYHEHHKGHW